MESIETFRKEILFSPEKDTYDSKISFNPESSQVLESFDSTQFFEISPPPKKNLFITKKNKTSFITIKKPEPVTQKKQKLNDSCLNGRWTKQERIKFAYALWQFGTNWKKIMKYVSSRNNEQLRSHAQKFLNKLKANESLAKKGLNFKNLNWENSIKYLKEKLSNEELFNILSSIESELDDNKRMTERYLERKRLRNKTNLNTNEESCNSSMSSFEESYTNSTKKINEKELNSVYELNDVDEYHKNIYLEEEKYDEKILNKDNYLNNGFVYENQEDNNNIFFNIFTKNLSSIYENSLTPEKDNYEFKNNFDFYKY
jgi:SHAQKYF class myb-like DNA-binding protein